MEEKTMIDTLILIGYLVPVITATFAIARVFSRVKSNSARITELERERPATIEMKTDIAEIKNDIKWIKQLASAFITPPTKNKEN